MPNLHKNLWLSGQIEPQDIQTLKAEGFSMIINNRPDGEEAGQPSSEQMRELAEASGLQYFYLPMTNGQPLPDHIVAEFRTLVVQPEHKILAHCRSGMRSSVIWALGAIADGEVSSDEAIAKGVAAGIPLHNAKPLLESVEASA